MSRPSSRGTAARDRRRTWLASLAVVVLLAMVVGVLLVSGTTPSSAGGPGVAGGSTVTASSTAPGYSATDVVTSGSATDPGRPWHSTDGVGAWVEFVWPTRFTMRQIVLVQEAADRHRVSEGYLTFGDGSRLLVQLSSRVTVVPLMERSVDRVRFTASRLAPGVDTAGLGEVLVNSDVPSTSVAHDGAREGDVAPTARVSASSGSDPGAVTAAEPAAPDAGWSTQIPPGGAWVQLDWAAPRELDAIQLAGAQGGVGRIARGTLTFSDGSSLPVGAVPADPRLPTTVAFMPRVVTSLRLTVDAAAGDDDGITLGALRAFEGRTAPSRPAPPSVTAGPVPSTRAESGCTGPSGQADTLTVLCPQNGAVVDGPVAVRVSGAADRAAVEATVWPSDASAPADNPVTAAPDPSGNAQVDVDPGGAPPGPFTVRIRATGGGRADQVAFLQLYRSGLAPATPSESGPAAGGRSLVYDQEFGRSVSISRSGEGTEYTAAKPVHDGVQDFGDAVFADPASGLATLSVVDGRFLRIGAEPLPAGTRDPQGWGRTSAGGMLASARPGGSGFSAQYGYFEARMYAPAAPGTWPAFWMLPSDNLIAPTRSVAEVDAVELYGHEPRGACMSTHQYRGGDDGGLGQCREDLFGSERAAMAWHTFGVSIAPDVIEFWVDGRIVATAPQVDGGAAPMFFLVNLALGGGWPVDLTGTAGRADLYVDYVRIYV